MTMIAALIPVLNRPKNVRPLIENFNANSRTDSGLFFIVQENDIAEMAMIQTVVASLPDPESAETERIVIMMVCDDFVTRWSQKLNTAHVWMNREVCEGDDGSPQLVPPPDWYLLGADDLRFEKGWDDNDALKKLMDDPKIGVIGTNDKGNPVVIAGKHSTHPFIRTEYVDRYGIQEAAGLIAPEIYHHCFVDNEIVATARHRGAYAHCHESVIEHMHPVWRKSENDATYKLGSDPEKFRQDRKMFEARSALYGWPKWNEGW